MPSRTGHRERSSTRQPLQNRSRIIRRLGAISKAVSNAQNKVIPQPIRLALDLLVITATYSPISQLSLSPLYGSIPASIYHRKLVLFTVLLAWVTKIQYQDSVERSLETWITYIPLVAMSVPLMQIQLFKQSASLGPLYGPLITEICTYAPLLFLSVLAAAVKLEKPLLSRFGSILATAVSTSLALAVIVLVQNIMTQKIQDGIGSRPWFSRTGLQYLVAIIYALKLPSRKIGYAFCLLTYLLATDSHIPSAAHTKALNETLLNQHYSLVARQESLTGYISVLDNIKDGFRVMRCDHSLLGGEWLNTPRNAVSGLKEPIYAIFTMLEAVRLVKPDSGTAEKSDKEKEALVIGLGIGTTPSALIALGIQTTIVEIDPVVHRYASRYFNLPTNHTAVIQDAISFVEERRKNQSEDRFDYIIHDVFTGGAEPAALFTQEFLSGLNYLLKQDGIIAINYAGDLLLPSTSLVVKTIKSVFPRCRMFREEEARSGTPNPIKDFTNMVLFCRKSSESSEISFRKPAPADFLGSHARKHHLLPKHEIDPKIFDRKGSLGEGDILRQGRTQVLEKSQRESALGHWRIMRSVLPDQVWENW